MLGNDTTLNYIQFDSRAGATWHCIVGRNFGSFVTHGKWRHRAPTVNVR